MNATTEARPAYEPQPAPAPATSLRVALLHPCYWPEVRRGAERMLREIANGLLARGHAVRLITSHPGRPTRSVEDGMEVLRLWRPPQGRLHRRLFEDYLTHLPLTYLALRAGEDHIAHSLSVPDAVTAVRWAQHAHRPVVLTYMGIPTRRFLVARRKRTELTVAACGGVDAVVAISRAAADGFRETLGVEARVIYPSVDLERFSPGGVRAEAPTIFCAAPIEVEYKRVGLLLRALPIVRRMLPDARLAIHAPRDPTYAAQLLADTPGLEYVDPGPAAEGLVDLYRRAWVSALPSVGEAFGLVLAEALACGTPVVGTAAGAFPEVIDRPEVGATFSGGEHELAAALLSAIEMSRDATTPVACRRSAQRFSVEVAAAEYEQLYAGLMASRG